MKEKKPSKKYEPKGLTILYEDRDIIVINKTNGLLTIATDREKDKTAYHLLTNYVKKGSDFSKNRIFIVHRLDRETSGIIVFAKTEEVKRYLQDNWKDFSKKYYTLVHGIMEQKEGEYSSYLTENSKHFMFSIDDPQKGKYAETKYKVIKEKGKFSLLEITLLTGRKNQIRVHLSEAGHPIVGDKIYGIKDRVVKKLALHAASLTINHPFSKKEMTFKTEPPKFFKDVMNGKY